MVFVPIKPVCLSGQINNALVPAVTYCTLVFEKVFDYDLGSYQNGFWTQSNNTTLPFLTQSFKGQYISPALNGAIEARAWGR